MQLTYEFLSFAYKSILGKYFLEEMGERNDNIYCIHLILLFQ